MYIGYKGYINQGAYTVSKHALMGMTKVLAQEVFKDNVRVHIIVPGGVATDMVAKTRPDLDESMLATPQEIAEFIHI
ncbi:MAG TPA: SDR family oxidoreductase [Clostridiaceae bacterium]|nr:SDR family oxidoreductase [Clostridiaceae bacterium]